MGPLFTETTGAVGELKVQFALASLFPHAHIFSLFIPSPSGATTHLGPCGSVFRRGNHTGDFRRVGTRERLSGPTGAFVGPIIQYCNSRSSAAEGMACTHKGHSLCIKQNHWSCCGRGMLDDCTREGERFNPRSHTGSWRDLENDKVHTRGGIQECGRQCCELDRGKPGDQRCTHPGGILRRNHWTCECFSHGGQPLRTPARTFYPRPRPPMHTLSLSHTLVLSGCGRNDYFKECGAAGGDADEEEEEEDMDPLAALARGEVELPAELRDLLRRGGGPGGPGGPRGPAGGSAGAGGGGPPCPQQ